MLVALILRTRLLPVQVERALHPDGDRVVNEDGAELLDYPLWEETRRAAVEDISRTLP